MPEQHTGAIVFVAAPNLALERWAGSLFLYSHPRGFIGAAFPPDTEGPDARERGKSRGRRGRSLGGMRVIARANRAETRGAEHAPTDARAGGLIGFLAGLVGIGCCVSPVVLYLVGAASATTAVSLGNTLYYDYGWYFRGAGLVLGGSAVYIYLRRRDACDLRGVRVHWRTIAAAGGIAVGTYVALYALTTWLGTLATKSA